MKVIYVNISKLMTQGSDGSAVVFHVIFQLQQRVNSLVVLWCISGFVFQLFFFSYFGF